MKEKDNVINNKIISIKDRVNFFENSATQNINKPQRKSAFIDYSTLEDKLSFGNKDNYYQQKKPKENNNNKKNINISKKHDKTDNKYYLKTEREKNNENIKDKKINKINFNKENGIFGKVSIFESNKKKETNVNPERKKDKISILSNNNNAEKINQIEEKNKSFNNKINNNEKNNNNKKGVIKSIERINIVNNDKKINDKDNNKNISKKNNIEKQTNNNINIKNNDNNNNIKINDKNNDNNKNNNDNKIIHHKNNYIKQIKQLPNNNSQKEKKAFNNNEFLPKDINDNQKRREQEKINKNDNENKKIEKTSFNNRVAFFNKEQNNPRINNNKNINQENLIESNIKEMIKRNSSHEKKKDEKNSNKMIEKFSNNKKPSKNKNKIKDNNVDYNLKKDKIDISPKKKEIDSHPSTTNNITTIKNEKMHSSKNKKEINDFDETLNIENIINKKNNNQKKIRFKQESPKENKESTINVKSRPSKSLPKIQTLNKKSHGVIEYIILKNNIPIKSETKTNSFCKAFFISSFSKNNSIIIDNSEEDLADCQHKECSLLPAFEPEIIYKYPEKDSKELEINNILASICFPNNIKICYCNEEEKIYTLKNYRTCFTNQVGDRSYAVMYHFYKRMKNNDFYKEYKTSLMEKMTIKYSGEINENVEEKTELINEINHKKYVYIPHCLCLISKYPYFSQMEKCLESIMITLKHREIQKDELNEVIAYLVKGIPSPYINTSISFVIPYIDDIIEVKSGFYQEIYVYGPDAASLLDILSINNIIILLRLLLFEQKILLISDNYDNLTKVSLNLISLLYPLSWVHIYIPIVSEKMLKYLQSFLPFLNGMHKSLFGQEKVQNMLIKSHKDLYIYDIDKNKLNISCNLSGKKKISATKYMNKNVPSFPKKIEDLIIYQLNYLKTYKNNSDENNYISNNIKMKLIFIQTFIELFFNYKKYLTIIGDLPVFNTKDFLIEKPESDKIFYKEITSTQLFQIFIQNSLHYINHKNKNYYFDELIGLYLDKKQKNIKYKIHTAYDDEFNSNLNKTLYTIKKTYIIKPPNLKLLEAIKKENDFSKGKKILDEIKNNLKNAFKYIYNLKENNRIVNNNINLSNKNDIKNCVYFITQEEEIENETEKANDNENEKINSDEDKDEPKIKKYKSHSISLDLNNNCNEDKEEGLTSVEKEDIRDNIRETLTRVFKSEKVNVVKDSAVLLSSIEKQYGRKYFINIIEKNRNSKEVKIISSDSFKILLEVIIKSLSKLNIDKIDLIYIVKLIKSTNYFKTIVKKQIYTLFEKVCEILTKNYKIFNEIKYWELWIEDELNQNDLKILNNLKHINENKEKNEYNYIDEDDEEIVNFKEKYKIYLKDAKNNMIKMKLNRSFILTLVEELCKKYLIDEDYQKKLVGEIMNL